MEIASWPSSELQRHAIEVQELGLVQNVYELDNFGLTVVPTERLGALHLVDRALERILDIAEQRSGARPDPVTGDTHLDVITPSLHYLLFEDEVFEQLMMHPSLLALVTHLVGRRCVLAGTSVFMKGPSTLAAGNPLGMGASGSALQLGLHSDNVLHPAPFAPYAEICNATWLLSDYTKELGALAFVPGSHLLCRAPLDGEAVEQAVAVEAPRGSLVVWHGNTWHGSYPRRVPGLRTGLSFGFARSYIAVNEDYRTTAPQEALDRHPPRFARLLGRDLLMWGEEGPDYGKLLRRPARPTVHS